MERTPSILSDTSRGLHLRQALLVLTCLVSFFIGYLPQIFLASLLFIAGCTIILFSHTRQHIRWAAPFLSCVFLSLLGVAFSQLDLSALKTVFLVHPETILPVFRDTYFPLFIGLKEFLALFLFVFSLSYWGNNSGQDRSSPFIVLSAASLVFVLVLGATFFHTQILPEPSNPTFWRGVGRVAATLTDPNACGLVAFFVVGYALVHLAKGMRSGEKTFITLSLFVFTGWTFIALQSGSRTFLLGLLLVAVQAGWKFSKKTLLVLIALAGCTLTFSIFQPKVTNHFLEMTHAPSAIVRAVESFQHGDGQGGEGFFSRAVFMRAATSVWLTSPVFGVGFNRFEQVLPSVEGSLGVDLKGWRDNPNNFYLGTLAELGVVGVIALLLLFRVIQFRTAEQEGETLRRFFIISFALLLIFGPHLDFLEVALIAGLFCAEGVEIQRCENSKSWSVVLLKYLPVAAIYLILIVVVQDRFSRGLYAAEGGEGTQWSQRKGMITLECNQKLQSAGMTFSAPFAPQIASAPLVVQLSTLDRSFSRTVELRDGSLQNLEIPCKTYPFEKKSLLQIYFTCSRFWIPRWLEINEDSRILCLKVTPDKG